MKSFNMDSDFFVSDLESGKGSPKHYKYFVSRMRIFHKSDIYKGLKLKLPVMRVDKITNRTEVFNYSNMRFE
jgi:hypothetical protein